MCGWVLRPLNGPHEEARKQSWDLCPVAIERGETQSASKFMAHGWLPGSTGEQSRGCAALRLACVVRALPLTIELMMLLLLIAQSHHGGQSPARRRSPTRRMKPQFVLTGLSTSPTNQWPSTTRDHVRLLHCRRRVCTCPTVTPLGRSFSPLPIHREPTRPTLWAQYHS